MNLGDHVGDEPVHVQANRQHLQQALSARSACDVQPVFLQQVHGCEVLALRSGIAHGQAYDACVATATGLACTVMVADCLPVLFAHRRGLAVAAAHAGWRGLVGAQGHGVLEATWQAYAQQLQVPADAALAAQTQVWLGPCIGPHAFEVGEEVRAAFMAASPRAAQCFVSAPSAVAGKWLADLAGLARQRLQQCGLHHIYGNDSSTDWCTVSNASTFFSHRRDAKLLGTTGRMAACIWRDGSGNFV